METHMKTQISVIISTLKSMEANLTLTAMKNDGRIDAEEAKAIKKVQAATKKYITALEKIK